MSRILAENVKIRHSFLRESLVNGNGLWYAFREVIGMANICEECVHYDYDDEIEAYYCTMDLDEDEMERFLRSANNACPFYRRGDDYRTARRQ